IPPEKCGSVPGRLLADLRLRTSPRLGRRGFPDLRTQLVLLYEREQLHHGSSAESGAGSVAGQDQEIGCSTRQAEYDAGTVANEDVAVWIARRGDDFKLAAIQRMGRIGHFKATANIWVVEGGINIAYRSTPSITNGW